MGLFGGAFYLLFTKTRGMESPATKSGGSSFAGSTLRFYWPAGKKPWRRDRPKKGWTCAGG
jgi:hypothetical protein